MIAKQRAVVPGEPIVVGVRMKMDPHWHTYWRNPGDSGEAPRLHWELPDGWQAGEVHWPIPRRIPVGPFVNYGYEDQVTLLVPIETGAATPSGRARIAVDASWLVCREECIPEQATLSLDLPVAAETDGAAGAAQTEFEAVRGRWPLPFPGEAAYRPDVAKNPADPLAAYMERMGQIEHVRAAPAVLDADLAGTEAPQAVGGC